MAIKINIKTGHGLIINDAYLLITSIYADKKEIKFVLYAFLNEEARHNGLQPLWTEVYTVPTEEIKGDLLPGLYDYLKTLQEFCPNQDC